MGIKGISSRFFSLLLFCNIFFFIEVYIYGEDPSDRNQQRGKDAAYCLEKKEGKMRFVQRLEWEALENIDQYELIIEKKENSGQYSNEPKVRLFTKVPWGEVSLSAGNYRYRVGVYNLLGQLELFSDYQEFEVLEAKQPFIRFFTPKTIYLDENEEQTLSIHGKNLFRDSEISLFLQKGKKNTLCSEERKKIIGNIFESDEKGRKVTVSFPIRQLDVGLYEIQVQNPGGLTEQLGSLKVSFQKLFDIHLSFGYSPGILLYGDSLMKHFEGQCVFPAGVSGRADFLLLKRKCGHWGFSIWGAWIFLRQEVQSYTISTHSFTGCLDFLYQYPIIKKRLLCNLRAGAGISVLHDLHFTYKNGDFSPSITTWCPSIHVGASLQVFLYRRFFLDTGAEYQNFFTAKDFTGIFQPCLSVGWQF